MSVYIFPVQLTHRSADSRKRSSSFSSQEFLTDENERYIDISDCDTPHRANCSAVKERATNPFSFFFFSPNAPALAI
jgi:hypothetical protein